MWGQYSRSREAETTIPCKHCGSKLKAKRYCQEVVMQCDSCRKTSPVSEYVAQMDDALETFMEGVFCDRV